MNELETPNVMVGNEDLVFDLKAKKLIKISDPLKKYFGDTFISNISTVEEFNSFTSSLVVDKNKKFERSILEKGYQFFDYTIHLNDVKFVIKERCWVNPEKNTFHSIIRFQDNKNVFEVSFPALVEIVEKMMYPAVLFDQALTQALVVNDALAPLLNLPISDFPSQIALKDFFVEEESYGEVVSWVLERENSSLSLNAKLYLGDKEGTWYDLSIYKTSPDDQLLILCILKDISKQKATEDKLQRTNELLSSVIEVQSHFLSKSEDANPYNLLLTNILNVVDAKIGFVGKIDQDVDGKRELRIHAATDVSITSDAFCLLNEKVDKEHFIFPLFNALFVACKTESKIVLENNPQFDPNINGDQNSGFLSIENFLGVPIFKGDDILGLVGLGNKSGGFTEQDILDLNPFISTYSIIIEAFQAEQDKIRFEKESNIRAQILAKVAVHSPDLIVVMNDSSEFEFISPSASQFFDKGGSVEEMQRKISILLRKTINPKFQMSEERYRSRLRLYFNNGEYWVESNVNILNEKNNRKVIAVIRDVSSQMDYEHKLVEALEKERLFNSFVSDFMNIVSHEFKTPLATIISSIELSKYYLESLPEVPEITKMKMHYKKIERELQNLHRLVAQSLDYSRFANNSPVLKNEEILFVPFVKDTLKAHGFLSKVEYNSEVPFDKIVYWDKFLIQTSIVNLVSNALKYGGKIKKPIVRLFQNNTSFGIEVRDFGIGILKEELPYVFTPFFRGSNVRGIAGTGFGLVAVKNFIEMHNGEIKIESMLLEGTSVIVSFKE